MAETIKVLVSEEEVNERIKTWENRSAKIMQESRFHMICVLKGGDIFHV